MISAMHPFDRPTVFDEVGRQEVEQLRMSRLGAFGAEVVRVGGDPVAEVVLPNAIDDAASRQRVLRVGDPAGQGQASTIDRSVVSR